MGWLVWMWREEGQSGYRYCVWLISNVDLADRICGVCVGSGVCVEAEIFIVRCDRES